MPDEPTREINKTWTWSRPTKDSDSITPVRVEFVIDQRKGAAFSAQFKGWFKQVGSSPDIQFRCNCSIDKADVTCVGAPSPSETVHLSTQNKTPIGQEIPTRLNVIASGWRNMGGFNQGWEMSGILILQSGKEPGKGSGNGELNNGTPRRK